MNHSAPESGIASVLASRGRNGDSMLVHMTPGEVKGLQALALAHGGSLTINPQTGLYEASALKKILPMLAGAALGPGGFGVFKTALGAGLTVGAVTGLIEGDLKKGLMAGLGAYSGANLTSALRAAGGENVVNARTAAPDSVSVAPASAGLGKFEEATNLSNITTPSIKPELRLPTDKISGGMAAAIDPTRAIPTVTQRPGLFESAGRLFTSPDARGRFTEALGGGFQSPFAQNMSKWATFAGVADALSPELPEMPSGAAGEDIVYIPGGFNPMYGKGREHPYQLPGQYYKRTSKGLTPYNPWRRGYAAGGIVDPNRDPGGAVLLPAQRPASPFSTPAKDPYVAATRAYIEDLNARARNPEVKAYPGTAAGGLGSFNVPFTPYVAPSGGAESVGGGSVTGSPLGDLAVSIGGQYLLDKGVQKGVGYLKDKFATGDRAEIGDNPVEVTRVPDPSAGLGSFVNRPLIDPLAGTDVASIPTKPVADISSLYNVPNINTGVAAATAPIPSSAAGIGSLATRSLIDPLAGIDVASMPVNPVADLSSLYDVPNINTGVDIAGKILPGVATALGAYNTAKAIEAGKEGRAAFSAAATMPAAAKLLNIGAIGGPAGMLAAAAIAAIGASMVTTKEFGDKALENYWKAVDAGRGIGQTPPEELAQGFINFYRTNKNEFPGQAKYGRTGNEDFVYDMTQVINNAVKDGKVSKDVDAATMYEQVVQPWLNTMGSGPKNEDARRIQDFMMTDLINSFMQGKPISNAQVKGDKKFKIVSEKPVYAGIPSAALQRGEMGGVYGQMPVGFEGRPDEFRDIGRDEFRTPFSEPQAAASSDVRRVQEILANTRSPIDAYREIFNPPAPTPFSEPQAVASPPMQEVVGSAVTMPVGTQFEAPGRPVAPSEYRAPVALPVAPPPGLVPLPSTSPPLKKAAPTPFSESEERDYIPTPFSEPRELPPVTTPYLPRIIEEEIAPPAPPPQMKVPEIGIPTIPPTPPEPDFVVRPLPVPVPFEEPEREYIQPIKTPFSEIESEEIPRPRGRGGKQGAAVSKFNYGGAVGEGYNFGFAGGGMPGEYAAGGKLLEGPGDGMSDDIPAVIRGKGVQRAALADGEFVIPADVVSHLGNGSTKAGAKKLYDMMARVRKARTGKTNQAPAVKTDRLLPA